MNIKKVTILLTHGRQLRGKVNVMTNLLEELGTRLLFASNISRARYVGLVLLSIGFWGF